MDNYIKREWFKHSCQKAEIDIKARVTYALYVRNSLKYKNIDRLRATATRQKIGHLIGNEEIKLSPFANNIYSKP